MQPDEIIQTFEWADLDETDKYSIKELASNEKEFNLLKAMLKASSEEYVGIPDLSGSVKDKILLETSTRSVFRISKYWYMAAAAIIAFGFLTFILLKNEPKNEIVKQKDVPEEHQIPGSPITKPVDTASLVITEKPKTKMKKIVEKSGIKNYRNIKSEIVAETLESEFYVKNVSVKQDKELLNLITEIF